MKRGRVESVTLKASVELPYRPGVGLMIINDNCEVFVGKRADSKVEAWQMPQGGIDEGESEEKAALREMHEEIGNDYGEILAITAKSYTYDIPEYLIPKLWNGKYRGQKQKWFLIKYLGKDKDINISASKYSEFLEWKWSKIEELPNIIIPFKKQIYINVIEEFRDHILKLKGF